ncbi:MAG TPA: hypothetical protein VD965_06995 [Burkholderiales bacterium]|nr:hypothetical protein [Burkholderiales bacterium]
MKRLLPVALALAAIPAFAQQRVPVPDPRIEQVINQTLIVAMDRSVTPAKTIPPVQVPRPAVPEAEYKRVDDSLYIDRRLLPPASQSDDGDAVRIFRKDVR